MPPWCSTSSCSRSRNDPALRATARQWPSMPTGATPMHDLKRLAVSVLLVSIALAGCNRAGDADAARDTASADAGATADGEAGDVDRIAGLPTEKDRVSYMVGMALARQFEPIREELDVDMVVKALKTSLEGGELLMTQEQAQQVGARF